MKKIILLIMLMFMVSNVSAVTYHYGVEDIYRNQVRENIENAFGKNETLFLEYEFGEVQYQLRNMEQLQIQQQKLQNLDSEDKLRLATMEQIRFRTEGEKAFIDVKERERFLGFIPLQRQNTYEIQGLNLVREESRWDWAWSR